MSEQIHQKVHFQPQLRTLTNSSILLFSGVSVSLTWNYVWMGEENNETLSKLQPLDKSLSLSFVFLYLLFIVCVVSIKLF